MEYYVCALVTKQALENCCIGSKVLKNVIPHALFIHSFAPPFRDF